VLDAIKLHVDAKRYLCQSHPEYVERLSDDSRRSLALQGGAFDASQAAAFIALTSARDALRLRLWDDLAKQDGLRTPTLAHFLERAQRCVIAR
jgi:predicted HD phosphohydrolase